MKKYLITGTVITAVALAAQAQQSVPSAPPAQPATPQAQPPPIVPRGNYGLFSSNQLSRFRTNVNMLGTNSSSFGTNAYTHLTNGWAWLSNRFRATNVSPTSDRGLTNRMYGTNGFSTNGFSATNSANLQLHDEAFTPIDQTLLVQIRQTVRPLFLTAGNRQGLLPVHFICRDRTVTVVGYVPNEEQKRRVVSLVRETPGVVQVVDNLQVSPAGEIAGSEGQYSQSESTETQPVVSQDQAYTSADRTVLVQVRQAVQPIIGNSSPWMPVHFISQDGVVTLVGAVPSEQQKQQIFQAVQQTPGVVQVVNQIQVNTALGATGNGGMNATNGLGTGNNLGFNSTNQFGSNMVGMGSNNAALGTNAFGLTQTNAYGSTNLVPTGRTNSERVYPDQDRDLPPGLRNRQSLPPGLQKRDELPPGLERRTNAPASSDNR